MLKTTQVLQGRYQLQQQLGNNAGRQTWLATDIQTSPAEPVTVKLLAFSPQMQWDEFKLFEREASVLKQLNHPRIPKYRDYFSLDKQRGAGLCWFGLVQDYIPGSSLQQLLDKGRRFTETQVRSFATQVLKILTYLHGLNPPVLHRDIKPSNLIIGEDEQVYLVDFGAVQDTAAVEGVTFTVVGTTGYAPLEQFWGQAVPASDLYALGATLIHLLTGIPPADLPQRNLRIQFTDQVSINPAFLSWIEALTEPDLDLRLSTAAQALEGLETGRFISYPLQTVHPPFRSKIQLKKSPTQLTIKIPGQGIFVIGEFFIWLMKWTLVFSLGISLLILGLFLVVALLLLISIIILNFSFIKPFIAVFLWLLLAIGVLYLVGALLKVGYKEFMKLFKDIGSTKFSPFGKSWIEFQRSHISIRRSYFNLFSFRRQAKLSDKSLEVFSLADIRTIFLRIGSNSYCLGKTSNQAEFNWLMKEIQEWLL